MSSPDWRPHTSSAMSYHTPPTYRYAGSDLPKNFQRDLTPSMEIFTPPPLPPFPSDAPPSASSCPLLTSHPGTGPPPLPPPPRDLPEGYRASAITDGMPGVLARSGRTSADESHSPPASPDPSGGRPRRGSFGFLSRSKSRSREVPTVTAANGQTMLRKQKLRAAEEERLRHQREREARPPPRLPSHSPLPILNTFGGEDARPDSIAIVSNKATSNFSRPYPTNPTPSSQHTMPGSASLPILHKQQPNYSSPAPYQRSPSVRDNMGNNGEYVPPRERIGSMASGHYSVASSAVGNVNSPRRVRRRKDPTPFK